MKKNFPNVRFTVEDCIGYASQDHMMRMMHDGNSTDRKSSKEIVS